MLFVLRWILPAQFMESQKSNREEGSRNEAKYPEDQGRSSWDCVARLFLGERLHSRKLTSHNGEVR